MACPDLIISDGSVTVTVPIGPDFHVGQSYAPSVDIQKDSVSSNAGVTRNLNGDLIVQEACGADNPETPPDPATAAEIEATLRKLKTTITISGRYPLNIQALSRSKVWTVHCVAPINGWAGASRAETYVTPYGTGKYPILQARPENGSPSGGMSEDGRFSYSIVAVEV